MYLGIDVGGSKTLLAIFSSNGDIKRVHKIPTAKNYPALVKDLEKILTHSDFKQSYRAVCCALPGRIDRKNGVGLSYGNLAWKKVPIKDDLAKILGELPITIENDAKLAAFYESRVNPNYRRLLYITISTGIGIGFTVDGALEPNFLDAEIGSTLFPFEGKLQKWEVFASGKALKKRFGKIAAEITDPSIWNEYVELLIPGFEALINTFQPDVMVIGGGVGAHFEKFGPRLSERLKQVSSDMAPVPPIIKAKKAEEAVIYGCYEFAKQSLA